MSPKKNINNPALKLCLLVIVAIVLCAFPLMANEPDAGIIISGFDSDDDDFDEADSIKKTENKKGFLSDFVFTLAHDFSYGTKQENKETITNRSSFSCEVDKTISDIFLLRFDGKSSLYFHNDHVSAAEQKQSTNEFSIKEFYLQAGFESFVLKAGKQVIVWGETDGDVMNDVVSPRDQSEFIFTELKDARCGQYMLTADFFSALGDIETFVTFRPDGNKTPEKDTQYDRVPDVLPISEERPKFSDNETGLKWKKSYQSFDFSLMAASLLQNTGVLQQKTIGDLVKKYERYSFYGLGTGFTTGCFLLKFDASFKQGFLMQTLENGYLFNGTKTDIADTAFAIEYDANGRYLVNIEITNRHIIDYSSAMVGSKKNNTGLYLLCNKKFMNETLIFQYVLFHQFQEKAYFHEAEFEYSFSDNIELSLKYNYFQIDKKESILQSYENEDRVGVRVKYFF